VTVTKTGDVMYVVLGLLLYCAAQKQTTVRYCGARAASLKSLLCNHYTTYRFVKNNVPSINWASPHCVFFRLLGKLASSLIDLL